MNTLRTAVSGTRKRFINEEFDLDLTYITPKVIAMGFPACGVEKTYRNDIVEVSNFLNKRHPGKYRVFNLSERKYDESRFCNRVEDVGFPDHHPPPLQLLCDVINKINDWMLQDKENVTVVHCLAGKGRTGVVITCYLIFSGYYGSVENLLCDKDVEKLANIGIRDFWTKRGQGVRFPSQGRYIFYFIKVLQQVGRLGTSDIPLLPKPKELYLGQIILHGIPNFDSQPKGGCTPFLQVLPGPSKKNRSDLIYNSAWDRPVFDSFSSNVDGFIRFKTNCLVSGDILIKCFHATPGAILGKHTIQMFHFSFHTDFLFEESTGVYRVRKSQIDDAKDNNRFPKNFLIDCIFEEVPSDACSTRPASNSVSAVKNSFNLCSQQHIRMSALEQKHGSRSSIACDEILEAANCEPMGWMIKMGGFVKNWKKRWFVLKDGNLSYFSKVNDPTPLGFVPLKGATIESCRLNEISHPTNKYVYFKIKPSSKNARIFYFGCMSEFDRTFWISAIEREVKSINHTTSSNSRSRKKEFGRNRSWTDYGNPAPPPIVNRENCTINENLRSENGHSINNGLSNISLNAPLTGIHNSATSTSSNSDGNTTNREANSTEKKVVASSVSSPLSEKGKSVSITDELYEEASNYNNFTYTQDELFAACELRKAMNDENPVLFLHYCELVERNTQVSTKEALEILIKAILDKNRDLIEPFEDEPIQLMTLVAKGKI